ncbi:MAG: ParA family protein [Planctomycetota bacterium]
MAITRQTFCLINQKGGVGKTSSCFHLSGAFSALGKRVLVVDADPQASISQGFLGPTAVEQLAVNNSISGLFSDSSAFTDWSSLIHQTEFPKIDLCPANLALAEFNSPKPEQTGTLQHALREFVESQSEYDIVLIDCPPNLYRCTWTAMIAADWVIVPVTPEDFGTQGLRPVHQAIEQARILNPQLRRLGHLVTRSDGRLLVHKFYERRLRQLHHDYVLENLMPELSAFKMAVAERKPVEFYDSRCRAARLTRDLCREILDRTSEKTERRRVA